MIESFQIKNIGPIKAASGKLSRIHAFIGPNDSGKSTILRALRTCALYVNGVSTTLPPPQSGEARFIGLNLTGGLTTSVTRLGDAQLVEPSRITNEARQEYLRQLRGAELLRLDPDAVGAPSALLPDGGLLRFTNERGAGLAGLCDALLNRADGSFDRFSAEVVRHFPAVRGLRLRTISPSMKTLEATLRDGSQVPAQFMSEGFLYFAALAILPFIDAGALLFLEEPENGLHPSRIAEVVRLLRTLTESGTQIVMATHSPLVVNELQPTEVTVVTRDEVSGTKLIPIAETHGFAERSKVYALGELWLSYANGRDEAALLSADGT